MNAATEAGKAAELIAFALQPKIARGADERYSALWNAYRTEEAFRDVVDAVAEGLGLVVLDAPDQGLIVAPTDRSPFSFRLADYRSGLRPTDRMLIGLVHLGIAAAAYPREADLEGDIVVRRTPEQVERLLRDACSRLADREDKDPEVSDEEQHAWRLYASTAPSNRLPKGGYRADCTLGIIERAFDWLVRQGMARDTGRGTYQLLDRYRVQVRELAGHAALKQLRDLAASSADTGSFPDAAGEDGTEEHEDDCREPPGPDDAPVGVEGLVDDDPALAEGSMPTDLPTNSQGAR